MLKQVARHEETIRRSVLLFLLYLIAPLQAMFHIIDPDIWWHLRTGQWILAHGTVRQKIHSQVMAWGKRGLPIAGFSRFWSRSFMVLGWRRKLDSFFLLRLAAGVFIPFRSLRDTWFTGVASEYILAESGVCLLYQSILTTVQTCMATSGYYALCRRGQVSPTGHPIRRSLLPAWLFDNVN